MTSDGGEDVALIISSASSTTSKAKKFYIRLDQIQDVYRIDCQASIHASS